MTVLHESLLAGDEKMTEWILKQNGVKLNVKDLNDQTPIMKGIIGKGTPQFKFDLLNQNQFQKDNVDSLGRNFFHLAVQNNNLDFFQYLGS